MKFCIKCGKELPNDAGFCLDCGTPMPDTEAGAGPGGSSAATSGAKTSQAGSGFQTELRPGIGYGTDLENLPEGFVLDDRYEIKEKVGHGGFGAVYRAYDRKMEIDKALKVLPRAVAEDKRSLESLLGEARTMAKLNHPHIVRLYEIHDSGPVKYLAMEYVGGGSLADKLFAAKDQRFSEEAVKKTALQVAGGLAYAHSQGVIHKDVKPQNILIADDGTAKVMDFGISETVRTSLSRLSNTTSSGTLVYMSPEQIRGRDVGKEADVYSFGAMLYELLCGHPPFHKGAIEHQILNEVPEPVEGVSDQMNAFLQKCLAKEYKDRFRSFEEVGAALKGEKAAARPSSASSVAEGFSPPSESAKVSATPSSKGPKTASASATSVPDQSSQDHHENASDDNLDYDDYLILEKQEQRHREKAGELKEFAGLSRRESVKFSLLLGGIYLLACAFYWHFPDSVRMVLWPGHILGTALAYFFWGVLELIDFFADSNLLNRLIRAVYKGRYFWIYIVAGSGLSLYSLVFLVKEIKNLKLFNQEADEHNKKAWEIHERLEKVTAR